MPKTTVPFEGMQVLVNPEGHLRGGDIMDPADWIECEVVGPPKGLNGDLRVMWGNPAVGITVSFDVSLNDVIPIQDA